MSPTTTASTTARHTCTAPTTLTMDSSNTSWNSSGWSSASPSTDSSYSHTGSSSSTSAGWSSSSSSSTTTFGPSASRSTSDASYFGSSGVSAFDRAGGWEAANPLENMPEYLRNDPEILQMQEQIRQAGARNRAAEQSLQGVLDEVTKGASPAA